MRPSPSAAASPAQPSRARLARALAILALLALLVSQVLPAGRAADGGKTITLGETLSNDQRQELLTFFKAASSDRIETVTVEDTAEAMDGIFDMTGITTAFSSTALTCRELGEGLDVTTRNIQLITPGLYAMALVTAGIGDATLVVAAPDGLAGVQGMTALAGVFKTWDLAPCASGDTNKTRQRLALEELTLTAGIGQAINVDGTLIGVERATVIVLETQQAIVISDLTTAEEISAALAEKEQQQGVGIPPAQREQLVDLLVRLANEEIDWSTFAKGWTIAYNADNTQITMRGDGIAIRNAQLTATAEAAAVLTATAQANAALTATAEAAALTATAAARPTETPVPPPTATPEPFGVSGTVESLTGAELRVKLTGAAEATAYQVDPKAAITRDGAPVELAKITKGDAVDLTVKGGTTLVTALVAQAPPVSLMSQIAKIIWLVPLGLVVPAAIFFVRGRSTDPFVVKRA